MEKRTYIMNCKDLGRKFTFNAENQEKATSKAIGYGLYHGMPGQFYATEATEADKAKYNDLHNEWVRNR